MAHAPRAARTEKKVEEYSCRVALADGQRDTEAYPDCGSHCVTLGPFLLGNRIGALT